MEHSSSYELAENIYGKIPGYTWNENGWDFICVCNAVGNNNYSLRCTAGLDLED